MTPGQQAVAYAMLYPEGAKGGRGKLARNRESFPGVSARTADNLVSRARFVVNNAPDLANEVLAGIVLAQVTRKSPLRASGFNGSLKSEFLPLPLGREARADNSGGRPQRAMLEAV